MKIQLLICYLFLVTHGYSQEFKKGGLKMGDTVSDILISNIRNYSSSTAKLSAFKSKLIIFDFWSKYCSSCIRGFPEMQKLQEEFKDKIQIILVTSNSISEVKDLLKTNPILKETKLPIVFGDLQLNKLFPHTAEPFHVWIDSARIVKATIFSQSTTSSNIRLFLKGEQANLRQRVDITDEHILSQSLLQQVYSAGQLSNLLSYSLFTGMHQGIPKTGIGENLGENSSERPGISIVNSSLIYMIRSAYQWDGDIIIDLKDSIDINKFYEPQDIDAIAGWTYGNTFCYELTLPVGYFSPSKTLKERHDELCEYFIQDLYRNFRLKAIVESRQLECLVISRKTPENLIESKGGNEIIASTEDGFWMLRNCSYEIIPNVIRANFLRRYGAKSPPIIDETGFAPNYLIDADIRLKDDLNTLRSDLNKYGLEIRMELRTIRCLLVKKIS